MSQGPDSEGIAPRPATASRAERPASSNSSYSGRAASSGVARRPTSALVASRTSELDSRTIRQSDDEHRQDLGGGEGTSGGAFALRWGEPDDVGLSRVAADGQRAAEQV